MIPNYVLLFSSPRQRVLILENPSRILHLLNNKGVLGKCTNHDNYGLMELDVSWLNLEPVAHGKKYNYKTIFSNYTFPFSSMHSNCQWEEMTY